MLITTATKIRTAVGLYPRCVIDNSRRVAIRSSRGGCVLNKEEIAPLPNNGFTMQRALVDGEMAVVGMRLL